MRSMLMLGGSGGMPPQKKLEKRCSEIVFLGHFQCNLDKLVGTASIVKIYKVYNIQATPSVLTNKQPITSERFTKPGHKH